MKFRILTAAMLFAVSTAATAIGLPDLGDVSQATFTPLIERRLGDRIMRDIRTHPQFFEDAEAAQPEVRACLDSNPPAEVSGLVAGLEADVEAALAATAPGTTDPGTTDPGTTAP